MCSFVTKGSVKRLISRLALAWYFYVSIQDFPFLSNDALTPISFIWTSYPMSPRIYKIQQSHNFVIDQLYLERRFFCELSRYPQVGWLYLWELNMKDKVYWNQLTHINFIGINGLETPSFLKKIRNPKGL